MKLLFSTLSDLSGMNGESTHVVELANSLALLGCEVHLTGIKKSDELSEKVKWYKLPDTVNKRGLSVLSQIIQKYSSANLIKKIIKKNKINAVYERYTHLNAGAVLGKKFGIPVVIELNGAIPVESGTNKIEKKEIEVLKSADSIVSASRGIKEFYVAQGIDGKKIHVVFNGVNTSLFKPMEKNGCRKELGINGKPLIVFSGSFRKYQGLEELIRAMPIVLKKLPKAKLVIVGGPGKFKGVEFKPAEGDLREMTLSLGVSDSIVFAGVVNHTEIPKYVNASDICICPFEKNRFGAVKIFEYMACRKPVIATRIPDLEEFKDCICLMEDNNSKEISESIIGLCKNKGYTEKIARNAFEKSGQITWKKTAERVLKIIKMCIGGKNNDEH